MSETKKNKLRGPKPRIEHFTALITGILFSHLLGGLHFAGSIRMLEKQYGLETRSTGFLWSTDNIISVFMVVILGYLGDKFSKPKIIGTSALIVGISYFGHALPYFVLPSTQIVRYNYGNLTSPQNLTIGTTQETTDIMCRAHAAGNSSGICGLKEGVTKDTWSSERAFHILVAARLLRGFGGAAFLNLATAYVSDNADQSKTSLILGIMMSMFAIGPVCGFLLAGFCSRLPLDLKDWSLSPDDPRFLGAWWLGFLISGSFMLLCAVPMMFFPKSLKTNTSKATDEEETISTKEKKSCSEHFKDIFRALCRLIQLKIYVVYVFAHMFFILCMIAGLFNVMRYFEIHFLMPIYRVNYIAGGSSVMAGVFGALGGGCLLSRLRMHTVTIAKCFALLNVFCLIAISAMIAFSCQQLTYAGTSYKTSGKSRISVSTPCSEACGCDVSASQPVCGSDGKNYFTPCHAGCTVRHGSFNEGNFTDCACVEGGTASVGTCPTGCWMMVPYSIALCLMATAIAVSRVPKTVLLLRILPKDVKSFGLGINSFIFNVFGFLPAPVIFGRLIDDTCDIWQEKCEQSGSCLLYNTGRFRDVTHGSAAVFMGITAILSFLGWWMVRGVHFAEDGDHKTPNETKVKFKAENEAEMPMIEQKLESKDHI